jgi:hypothetical protein
MPGALRAIKWLGIVALIAAVIVLWVMLDASHEQEQSLAQELDRVKQQRDAHAEQLQTIGEEATATNQLLVERKRKSIAKEEKTRENKAAIKQSIAGIHCAIPSDVTERLRQDY